MVSIAASIIFGVCGWLVAKLVFEPMKEIVELRREAQECLVLYGDLSKDAPLDERRIAAEAFRRVGAGLLSRHFAAYPWVRWAYSSQRWKVDIHSAGLMLFRIGNGIQFSGLSSLNNSGDVPLIRVALRLPFPEQSPVDRQFAATAAGPRSFELHP